MATIIPYFHSTFLLAAEDSPQDFVHVSPGAESLSITREPEGDSFYQRDKLSGPLTFRDTDFRFLYAIERSRQRCQRLVLTLECRPSATAAVAYRWRGSFSCTECEWDLNLCQVSVTPTPADGYTALLETWERPVNLLATPSLVSNVGVRTVTAQLDTLPTDAQIEFRRIGREEEADQVGTEGFAVFLRNTSFISNGLRDQTVLLFRYVRKAVTMIKNPDSGEYEPVDLSEQGYRVYQTNDGTMPPTADYAKEPEISGFKPYKIGTFADWWHTEGGQRYAIYGTQLLLLDEGKRPADYGFDNAGYLEVTGPGGAYNEETRPYLNVRRRRGQENRKSLWWRFGQFRFARCFPLLDGLYHLLNKTAPQLLPPTAAGLSRLLSAATNPVTGQAGADNELPGLLLSAGSDVKRYGSSEPATRLLVSAKEFINDVCTLYDAGWFIDPATGWFRLEHRSFFEDRNGPLLDLRSAGPYADTAIVPDKYAYRSETLPQFEQLKISQALTDELARGISFGEGEIEYSGACVNTREGQNTTTRTVQRLTGDVSALVLSGDSLPDSAIALLSPHVASTELRDGNRRLAASELLRCYHTYGRVRPSGEVNGRYQVFDSVRLSREQKDVSVPLCSLAPLPVGGHVATDLTAAARCVKAVLNINTGVVALTLLHAAPESDTEGPRYLRQFNDSFPLSFR